LLKDFSTSTCSSQGDHPHITLFITLL